MLVCQRTVVPQGYSELLAFICRGLYDLREPECDCIAPYEFSVSLYYNGLIQNLLCERFLEEGIVFEQLLKEDIPKFGFLDPNKNWKLIFKDDIFTQIKFELFLPTRDLRKINLDKSGKICYRATKGNSEIAILDHFAGVGETIEETIESFENAISEIVFKIKQIRTNAQNEISDSNSPEKNTGGR
jgi:hypothetical protein